MDDEAAGSGLRGLWRTRSRVANWTAAFCLRGRLRSVLRPAIPLAAGPTAFGRLGHRSLRSLAWQSPWQIAAYEADGGKLTGLWRTMSLTADSMTVFCSRGRLCLWQVAACNTAGGRLHRVWSTWPREPLFTRVAVSSEACH